ncbi:hypothetical protein LQZ19_07315 [Treponema primitia]|uniref:hypothetical protein n=1 Tax=Treponema primitia TaxID=88058 RepID=UPI00398176AC
MKKLKGDHLMISWHDKQNESKIGFDGKNFIIQMTLNKPVHNDWNCIEEKGTITCPVDVQKQCMTQGNLAPCIVGFVDLEKK